jgi:methyl-accepting chemotaxis protein
MFYVMRIEKRKKQDVSGIQKENNRTAAEYNNRVNTTQSGLNLPLIQSNHWMQDIRAEIERAGARTRSNSVVALDTLYTASPEFFEGKTREQTEKFFSDCLQFHQRQFGHIVSAVVHYDETTPHLHIVSVPLTADGRLSAREIVGNKQHMSRLQDSFFEQVGRGYGLERGMRSDGQERRRHVSAQEKRMRELEQQVSDLSERVERLTEQTELTAAEYRDSYKKTAHINELRQQARQELTQTRQQLKSLNNILTDAERRQIEQEQIKRDFPDFDDDFEDFTH